VLLKLIFLEEMEGWEEDILTDWIKGGRNGEILLSPDIRGRRDILRDRGYKHFNEVIFVGGRRSSKGYVTGIAGGYKLEMVRSLDNPGEFFKMDPEKVIDFTCIASSENVAITRQFGDVRSTIVGCSALKPYISKDLETILTIKTSADQDTIEQLKREGKKIGRDFAKLRITPSAANADTVRGAANIFVVYDEMAFFLPGESRSSAKSCYEALRPSLAQFGNYILVFLNSSPATKVGQFFDQAELAMRPQNGKEAWFPMRFLMKFPSWALYEEWWKDPQKRFDRPLYVSPDWPDQLDPDIPESALGQFSIEQREAEQLEEMANPDSYKVEARANWAEVMDAYLDPNKVDAAFSGILPSGESHFMTGNGSYEYEYMMHCDPSSTTAGFGFAIAHIEEFPDVTGLFPDGKARHVVFDKVKRWDPKSFPGGTINYIAVKEELAKYIKLYYPKILTFDQYNSKGLIQELQDLSHKMNIWETRIGEVTATAKTNWNRWEAFKTALYLGLVHIPADCIEPAGPLPEDFNHSEYAKQELKFLQLEATGQTLRVDKQDLGPIQTKDIADCIAEVTVKFLGSYLGNLGAKYLESHPQFGAEGGYQIGGRQPGGPMAGFNPGEKGSKLFDPGDYWRRGSNSNPMSARGIAGRRNRRY
jgi:hypothetical protein